MSALSPLLIFLIARILILKPNFDTEHFFDDVIGVSMNIGNTLRCIKFWESENQSKYIYTTPSVPPSDSCARIQRMAVVC